MYALYKKDDITVMYRTVPVSVVVPMDRIYT